MSQARVLIIQHESKVYCIIFGATVKEQRKKAKEFLKQMDFESISTAEASGMEVYADEIEVVR